jgi:hypothetical protein
MRKPKGRALIERARRRNYARTYMRNSIRYRSAWIPSKRIHDIRVAILGLAEPKFVNFKRPLMIFSEVQNPSDFSPKSIQEP